ncbi:GH3 auxin-responsive promoter-domain-containing protein [Pisolithus tinctorius]|nr:GH3 auxin-responsive promoter-domain-containing protein [Pisolithus tinctorius]
MFAPGLPIYIPLSSATTNRKSKQFVKYFRSQPYAHGPPPLRIKTTAFLFTFAYRDPVEVVTDSGEVTKRIPLCNQSSGVMRLQNNWSIETDDTRMGSIPPWATGFIIHHRSFLLIHALFALANTSLEGFAVTFLPYFIDMVHRTKKSGRTRLRYSEWIIPDFDQIDHVRPYLQIHLRANPQRADELQNIGPPLSYSRWAQRVWPNLKLLKGICSGTFAAALPQARSVLGPNVIIQPTLANDLIEFLDMTEGETMEKYFKRYWELQPGMFYQPVSTTYDGLWRYLIDDVIQVTGFDPRNGLPVFRYSRRKNLELRLPHAMITEADLVSVIHAISGEDTVQVHEFTTVVDDRKFPQTVGFFIGITGDIGPNAKFARQKAFAALAATSEEHQIAFDGASLVCPRFVLLSPRLLQTIGGGEVKAQEWIAERVMMEL